MNLKRARIMDFLGIGIDFGIVANILKNVNYETREKRETKKFMQFFRVY